MSFDFFFWQGYKHIAALDGFDHILFIVVLAAVYPVEEWRKVLVLVTAFTIGHSLTLILAALELIQVNRPLIELLIPITILSTAVLNFYEKPSFIQQESWHRGQMMRYIMAMVFGFIHGFAFSGQLLEMFGGVGESLIWLLFAFNLGIEVGQILVVVLVISIYTIFLKLFKIKAMHWNMALSGFAILASIAIFLGKLMKF